MSETHPTTESSAALAPGHKPVQRRSDIRILADLLGPGLSDAKALHIAESSWEQHQGLRGLLSQPESVLATQIGWDHNLARRIHASREFMERQLEEHLRRNAILTSPEETRRYLQNRLRDRRREVFLGLFLDTRHRVIRCEELFKGSIDGASVYPRVLAEKALRYGAAAVIVAHNHPSGISEPSLADQAITRRLRDALALLEIRLLDHFVIGDGTPVSMASRGLM